MKQVLPSYLLYQGLHYSKVYCSHESSIPRIIIINRGIPKGEELLDPQSYKSYLEETKKNVTQDNGNLIINYHKLTEEQFEELKENEEFQKDGISALLLHYFHADVDKSFSEWIITTVYVFFVGMLIRYHSNIAKPRTNRWVRIIPMIAVLE